MEVPTNSAGPPNSQEAKHWRLVLSLVQMEGCSFCHQQINLQQLQFTIAHLLSSFRSRGRELGQKHKELFLGFGLWKAALSCLHILFRFAQSDHRYVACQAQVNTGSQALSNQPMLLDNQRTSELYTVLRSCDNYRRKQQLKAPDLGLLEQKCIPTWWRRPRSASSEPFSGMTLGPVTSPSTYPVTP